MAKKKKTFGPALNSQISNEFAASQQYVAMAVYYDASTLPRLAAFFYRQALEEREHAMMMVQYLLDQGVDPIIPGIEAPQNGFADQNDLPASTASLQILLDLAHERLGLDRHDLC